MDLPLRRFAEAIRDQFNTITQWQERDRECIEAYHSGWQDYDYHESHFKNQDIRRLASIIRGPYSSGPKYEAGMRDVQVLGEIFSVSADQLLSGPRSTRIYLAGRLRRLGVFDFESDLLLKQQQATDFCRYFAELEPVIPIISEMATAHRRWRQLAMAESDAEREHRRHHREVFGKLFDWIDEVESREKEFLLYYLAELIGTSKQLKPGQVAIVRYLIQNPKGVRFEQLRAARNPTSGKPLTESEDNETIGVMLRRMNKPLERHQLKITTSTTENKIQILVKSYRKEN